MYCVDVDKFVCLGVAGAFHVDSLATDNIGMDPQLLEVLQQKVKSNANNNRMEMS